MTGVQPYQVILMDFVVAEHEHLLMFCWTLLIQRLYGMSMELMTTFWCVLLISNFLSHYFLTVNW